jgi:FAD/FMN-containing dehydrogenase/Fe-S oxidoreductase
MSEFTELKRETLARHLRRHLRGEVRFDPTSRRLWSTDASLYQIEPLGVVLPRSAEDVVATVQIAAEMRVPLTARGGGTSLSGQAIGPGIVLDCSKYLTAIVDYDATARTVRVQPGVVLDQLNRAVAADQLWFGPDVSTASRANLGGMIGNNSAGSRSLIYGKTSDHVRRLRVVLADGSSTEVGPLGTDEWERRAAPRSFEGNIYRRVHEVVSGYADEIRERFPRILRRVSGYNLDALLASGGYQPPAELANAPGVNTPRSPGLHQLIVGSEGTLGVVTEAELALVPRPKARGLLVPQFRSLSAAMAALAPCLEAGPSAVELLDQMLIDLAREHRTLRETLAVVPGRPAALLMVEFSSDDPAEVADRVERLQRRLQGVDGLTAVLPALEPGLREPLWNLRRASVPLLYSLAGERKPVAFVEDTAVPPERLPEYVERFRGLLHSHGTDGAFYGHASVGCLHIRPLLNLKDPTDVARMRRITADVTDLVLEFGGSLSGEHGDGLARSEWNAKMFGPELYQAFCEIKHAFDPEGLLNPGRIVEAPPMTANLRYGSDYRPLELPTVFDYSAQEGLAASIERCNGSGVCRKMQGGTMCPSYRATCDEKDSTRGRANALRLALSGQQPFQELRSRWLYDVLDLCLMCKACKTECPSGVDLAKLKAEFLSLYYRGRPRPLGHWLMAHIPQLNRFGAPFAPVINWLQERRLLRWLLEKAGGIDRRRSLPALHADHFRRWFQGRRRPARNDRVGRVLLLDDCFTTYNEPAIGQAAVQVLEAAGYDVELAGLTCCGRTMISKGFLPETRDLVQRQAPRLAERLTDGAPLLGLEPSCLLTLADEWPELVPGPHTQRIAAAAELADGWLASQLGAGRAELELAPRREMCVLHGHCHQKALRGAGGSAALLQQVPGLKVTVLDTGCCGMAGSFGFEREHYDLSVKIAELALLPALRSSPDALIAAPGTSCRHQIYDLAQRRALHPMEILAAVLP